MFTGLWCRIEWKQKWFEQSNEKQKKIQTIEWNKKDTNAKDVARNDMKDTKSSRRTGVSKIHGKPSTEGNRQDWRETHKTEDKAKETDEENKEIIECSN